MTRYLIPAALLAAVLLTGFDSSPETKRNDKLEVGAVLNDPRTLKYDYPTLIEVTADDEGRTTHQKYKDDMDAYVKARRSDRGRVFEAMVAYEANQQYAKEKNPTRVLVVAAELENNREEAADYPADLLLWKDRNIQKRYQLKSYKNAKDVIAFVTQPKRIKYHEHEIIVTHPEKLDEVRQRLTEQKKPLKPRWKKVEKALKDGRLTDEVKPGLKVPSREEAQKVTDDFLRKMFKRFEAKDGS